MMTAILCALLLVAAVLLIQSGCRKLMKVVCGGSKPAMESGRRRRR